MDNSEVNQDSIKIPLELNNNQKIALDELRSVFKGLNNGIYESISAKNNQNIHLKYIDASYINDTLCVFYYYGQLNGKKKWNIH